MKDLFIKKSLLLFLKESTFVVKDVVVDTWSIIKKHYISIASLCFLIFLTSTLSSVLAFYIKGMGVGLRIVMAIIFSTLFLIVHLTLFKYIFHLLDDEKSKALIMKTLPTRKQAFRFLEASVYFVLCIILVGLIFVPVMFVIDPILRYMVHVGWVDSFQQGGAVVMKVGIFLTIILIFITFLRISFFPFFIIDKNYDAFKSLKYSLAITKGNVIKILFLLLFLATTHFLYFFFTYLRWQMMAFFLNFISSFLVEPFSIVALAIVYRKMISQYQGNAQPNILRSIV